MLALGEGLGGGNGNAGADYRVIGLHYCLRYHRKGGVYCGQSLGSIGMR